MSTIRITAITNGTFSAAVALQARVTAGQQAGSISFYGIDVPVIISDAGMITFVQQEGVVAENDLLFIVDTQSTTSPSQPLAT